MSFTLVDRPAELPTLRRALTSQAWIALDSEAAGFHRYSDRLSLLQITTADGSWIVDPLAFDPSDALRGPLGNPAVEVLMHGADYDMRLLDRDLDIAIHGLFDTQIAASLLGESALGLAALLETYFGIKLSKKYQRADWAKRPLADDMLEYAASDTKHLRDLADILKDKLVKAGRLEWAMEECRALEKTRWVEDPGEDPVARVKGARDLQPREVAALREALAWRDGIARARDRATFRIVGDPSLLELVVKRPRTVDDLAEIKGFSVQLARQDGQELLDRLAAVDAVPERELVPYPRKPRGAGGPGRPTPEMEERAERLKEVRNRTADELGIDRGTLLPNAVVLEIARRVPRSQEELEMVPDLRRWQAEVLAGPLLAAMNKRAVAR